MNLNEKSGTEVEGQRQGWGVGVGGERGKTRKIKKNEESDENANKGVRALIKKGRGAKGRGRVEVVGRERIWKPI